MLDYRMLEQELSEVLRLGRRPVAVSFREAAPAGVAPIATTVPAGCSFWRIAAEGRTFYTVPRDHYNCPIGSYTHHLALPEDRAHELEKTLGWMAEIGYLKMEEVAGIPRLPEPPGAVIYAPLGATPVEPDVVIFIGQPGRVMLLQEAATRAGVGGKLPLLGRPTCMALPAALTHGVAASTGCIGNRVYTDVGDDELFVAIAGRDLPRVAEEARTIGAANAKLCDYHRARRQDLGSA